MDRENLWTRRTTTGKSATTTQTLESKENTQSRHWGPSKRFSSNDFTAASRSNTVNGVTPLNTNAVASPGASSAFGLGSGAFAAFGSSKTPRTPSSAVDLGKPSASAGTPSGEQERPSKPNAKPAQFSQPPNSSKDRQSTSPGAKPIWPLKYTWVIWYRPPASKNSDYEKSIKPMYKVTTAQDFWRVYSHLKRPSALPIVSDYHFFKDGVRPVWEDEENKRGGKWIMRLKKGVVDRYWDDMLLAVIGDQFAEAGEEVCGMVVSVRNGEDVLSVWTKNDGGRNVKIRETIKRVLNLPADTIIIWKSHDDSIAQRTAIDQARQEKGAEKRRNTVNENDRSTRERTNTAS